MSNLNEGTYLIKFVVDGEYKCNPNFTTITDAQGHFNNIIKIEYEYSDQPANS
jgi:hypothetical protein